MKEIRRDEYVFSVDVDRTREYYRTHSVCDCAACRNYCRQIRDALPKLDAWMHAFGVDLSRPDEVISEESEAGMDVICADYSVCGSIRAMGEYEMDLMDRQFVSMIVRSDSDSPNEQMGEHFTISVMQIQLPWVLDEPLPSTNEPTFLERLCRRRGSAMRGR